jgi:hypothetical protein
VGAPAATPSRSRHATAAAAVDDQDKSREQLLAELSEERMRHDATAQQLHSFKGMYEQLLRERGEEKFGARRLTLLKAQNMQMERQLSILADGIDTRRAALHELGTIVTGLEGSVRDAAVADAAGTPSAPSGGVQKTARRLTQLEHSVEAAKQRLSKYHRAELQYSANEEQFLASDAPLPVDSIYSATHTHLNLARVHTLESGLAELHEQCVQAHAMLSSLAVLAPVQQQVTNFLQSHHAAPPSSSRSNATERHAGAKATSPLQMHSLLDALRRAAFELQSLGVLLPSHTAFKGTHQSPAGAERPWPWLFAMQQALKKRGVPAAAVETLLARAELEESITSLRRDMFERELSFHREVQQLQSASLQQLLAHTDALMAKFHTSNNALYAEATKELAQCVDDFQRNSTHVNIQRLLSLLQSLFPSLRQLLEYRHTGDARIDSNGPAQRSGWAPLALSLQERVNEALIAFEERMRALRERYDALELQAQQADSTAPHEKGGPPRRKAATASRSDDGDDAGAPARPPSSRSRLPAEQEELAPFQF